MGDGIPRIADRECALSAWLFHLKYNKPIYFTFTLSICADIRQVKAQWMRLERLLACDSSTTYAVKQCSEVSPDVPMSDATRQTSILHNAKGAPPLSLTAGVGQESPAFLRSCAPAPKSEFRSTSQRLQPTAVTRRHLFPPPQGGLVVRVSLHLTSHSGGSSYPFLGVNSINHSIRLFPCRRN